MTMDMALALAAPAAGASSQQPAAGGLDGQSGTAGQESGVFGKLLVARVSDAGTVGRQNVQPQPVFRTAGNLSGGAWVELLGGAAGQSLFEKLDELLRLTEGAGPLSQAQQAEIEAALEELQAIMMAMFGIQLPQYDNSRSAIQTAQTSDSADAGTADADAAEGLALRGGLHETIAFVRAFLAEGAFRPLDRKESAMFEGLIGRLQRALTATDEKAGQDADDGRQPAAEIKVSGSDTRTPAEALLARLARGPVQASVAAVLTEAQRQGGTPNGPVLTEAPTATAVNATAQTPNVQQQTADAGEVQNAPADSADLTPITQAVQQPAANAASESARTAQVRQPVHTVHAERFHEVISGMAIRQMTLSASNGVSEARIRLVPEHLGEVAVRITLQNGQLTAQFMTESAAAKELIENQFVVLRGVLQSQGITVDRLEVTQGNAAAQSQMFQEQRQRGGQDRQEGGRGKHSDESLSVFESELIDQTAIRELGYGRAINVKA